MLVRTTSPGLRLASACCCAALLLGCSAKEPAAPIDDQPGCDATATEWTLWVTNQGTDIDSVFVLKPRESGGKAEADVLATIRVGKSPHEVTFTPDGRLAYVANLSTAGRNGTVSVIDTSTYQVVATVEAGITPHQPRVTPDGRFAWVANIGSNDVTVIDTATNQVSDPSIQVGDGPTEIAFTRDGTRAYVSNGDSGTVSVVDVASRKVTATIRTAHGAMGLVLTHDERLLIESEPLDNSVHVLDVASGSVVRVLTAGLMDAHGVALAGNRFLVTNATVDSVAMYDTGSLGRTGAAAVPGRPQIVAVSPDCKRAYTTLRDTVGVGVVDLASMKTLGVIDLGKGRVHGIAALRVKK